MGEAGRGSANGRGQQGFSQWERPAEVQPMGGVSRVQPMGEAGRGSANGRGQQRFSQWERAAEVQPMGRVGRGSANGRGRQKGGAGVEREAPAVLGLP